MQVLRTFFHWIPLFLLLGTHISSTLAQTTEIELNVRSPLAIIEGRTFQVSVKLSSKPTGNVTVTVTGYESVDVSLNKTTLMFTPDNYSAYQQIGVTGNWDVDQDNEIFTLLFGASGGGYDAVTLSLNTQILDNINYFGIRNFDSSISVGENGTYNNQVWLTRRPSTDVKINLSVEDPNLLTLTPSTLTFTPESYGDPQIVSVRGIDNTTIESLPRTRVNLSASGAVEYTGITHQWGVAVVDDEPLRLNIIEGTSKRRSIWMNPRSGNGDVYVFLRSSNPAIVTVSPERLRYPEAEGAQVISYSINATDNEALGDASATIEIVASANHLPPGASQPLPLRGWVVKVSDDERLSLAISGIPDKISTTAPLTATFTFNGDVTSFVNSDVTVIGGTKDNFTPVNARTYTLSITPNGNTDVMITVPANSATYGTKTGPLTPVSKTAVWEVAKPSVTIGDATSNEGDEITFIVTLQNNMPEKISVTPNFQDRTATKGTDYKQNVAPLSFAGTAGETQTFTVETIEDLQVEEDETFIVGLTITGSFETFTDSDSGTGTIIDDDSLPTNQPPSVAISCVPCRVNPEGQILLTATATDPDGDPLTYDWSATQGSFNGPTDGSSVIWIAPNEVGTPTISIEVSDGSGGSATAETQVEVFNQDPGFEQARYIFELPENQAGPFYLGTITSTDPEGQALEYQMVDGAPNKFQIGLTDGVVKYIGHGEDYEMKPDQFDLTVNAYDQYGGMNSVEVVINVIDVNELPVVTAICDPCRSPRDGRIRLEAMATDPDSDPVTYAWQAATGIFTHANEAITYWTTPTDTGHVEIVVEVSDPSGQTASASVTVQIFNRSPMLDASTYTFELPENLVGPQILGTVLAKDPDGDKINYEILSGDHTLFTVDRQRGMIQYIGSGEDYEIEPNQFDLTVGVQDPSGAKDSVGILIKVIDVNELPVVTAICDPCTTPRDSKVRLEASATDPEGDLLTYVWSSASGVFINADEAIAYWTSPTDTGRVEIVVEVSDASEKSISKSVTVAVFNQSPAFETSIYNFELSENSDGQTTPVSLGRVLAIDPDKDPLIYELASGDQQRFKVDSQEGVIQYIGPGESFEVLPNRFDLKIRAQDKFQADAQTEVVIAITNVNEAPEAFNDQAVTIEDHAVTIDVLANDKDPDNDILRVQSVEQASHGALEINSDGRVIYSPKSDYHGTDEFNYVVADGQGLTNRASVKVTIIPANDGPIAVGTIPNQALDEGGKGISLDLSMYFLDVDGDVLTYSARSDLSIVQIEVTKTILMVTPVNYGPAAVEIIASDPEGLTAIQRFEIDVSDRTQRAIIEHMLSSTARNHLASLRMAVGPEWNLLPVMHLGLKYWGETYHSAGRMLPLYPCRFGVTPPKCCRLRSCREKLKVDI